MVEVKSKPRPFELRSILSLSKCQVALVIGLRWRSESSVLALLQTHRIEADGLQPRDLTRINSYASVPLSAICMLPKMFRVISVGPGQNLGR